MDKMNNTIEPSEKNSAEKPSAAAPFVGLLFSLIIPVMILNQLPRKFPEFADQLGGWGLLVLALFFPLAHGSWEIVTKKKFGALPALGLLNVLGTGGLAAIGAEGIWFAVKEAFFPALIGVFVLASAFTPKPLARAIFMNDAFMYKDQIESSLNERGTMSEFVHELKRITLIFGGSFFVSAVLNFVLAIFIFTPISLEMTEQARAAALNEQVARMTWMGFVVIAVPSFACTALLFNHLIKSIRKLAGLTDEQIFRA